MPSAANNSMELDNSIRCVGFQITEPDPVMAGLLREARQRLAASPYRCLRNIECECEGDVVLIRGELPSYFFKQLAQELLRELNGCSAVENRTEVRLHST
jgi:osmotically-inducible protein OsmY